MCFSVLFAMEFVEQAGTECFYAGHRSVFFALPKTPSFSFAPNRSLSAAATKTQFGSFSDQTVEAVCCTRNLELLLPIKLSVKIRWQEKNTYAKSDRNSQICNEPYPCLLLLYGQCSHSLCSSEIYRLQGETKQIDVDTGNQRETYRLAGNINSIFYQ